MPERHILIIDDEPEFTKLLSYRLRKQSYHVVTASDGAQGRREIESGFDGVVLLDLRLPDVDGLELVEPFMRANADIRIIIMTAHGSVDAAVEATRRGAYDFVEKSDDDSRRISVAVKNAFENREMSSRVKELQDQVSDRYQFGRIVARSPQMQKLFEVLLHVRDSKVTVLLQGESGTGKELVARALHYEGPRHRGPFVALNCAGIPESLLESELFGHERGAFTGAIAAKKGKFELADGGTIFLDEIGEMPFHLQAKILRVIQERNVERVGSTVARPVDVRIISATHRNLLDMVQEKRFRDDLYYRLAVFPVHLPPLRERTGDIALLASHFLDKACKEERKQQMTMSLAAMRTLERYTFPGNVRELENIISHAVVVSSGPEVKLSDMPLAVLDSLRRPAAETDRDPDYEPERSVEQAFELMFQTLDEIPHLEHVERSLITRALQLSDGNVVQASRALGMSRATFYRRIERLGGKDALLEGGPAPDLDDEDTAEAW